MNKFPRTVFVRRLLLVSAGFLVWVSPVEAFWGGISGSPNPNTGDYTVSWINSGYTFYLEENPGGTSGWTTIVATTGTSYDFTDKTPDDYMYRLRYRNRVCTGWPEPVCTTTTTYSETTTVTVLADDGITSPPTEGTANTPGSTPYAVDVDTSGDAIIQVPIRVIPGVAKFGPSLSIEYDSGRGVDRIERSLPEDTLGYGWRLAGLSQIRRCVVNQSSSNTINLSNNDSLCIDGMPLVLASGTHFAVGAVYRTQIESFAKVEIKGSSGALWFEVTLPDGTVQQYGNGNSSRVDKNGGTDYQWSINKATSTDGNEIAYTYYHDVSNGINYILRIDYADAQVRFEYLSRTDAAAVLIGSASQTQSGFLHTIRVKYDDTLVREYRLLDEVVGGRRRLNKIQHCGYNEAGTTATCLASLDIDWLTPSPTMTGVDILVDGLIDSLDAIHQIEYGTITGSSHPFLFTERPYGNGSLPANTQLLSGTGALRHVTTKLRRDNGLGGFHDTTYAYQNVGVQSTKHWGFLGFYAQRIKDEQSGVVTYVQYRMDYPHFGQVARLHQFDDVYPSHTQTLTRSESDYAQQSISHSIGTSDISYASETIDFIYEGTSQLGASKATNVLTFSSGFVSQAVTTTQAGTGVSTGSSGGTWGDIPSYTISGLKNTSKSTVLFSSRTTSGNWLIHFPDSVTNETWPGAASGAGIVRDVTLSPEADSLRPTSIVQFPNHSSLTLSTVLTYDSSGRTGTITVNGDNVNSRVTSILSYRQDRYPWQVENPYEHVTSYNSYDHRFGTVTTTSDANGISNWIARDPFGRVASTTNSDSVVTTTAYTDCPTGCGVTVFGISPSYYVETSSLVTPTRITYYDSLNRVLRTQTESFSGSTYSKIDTKYDTLGRIEKTSLPYFSGTSKNVVPTYDIRNRVINVSRPDGSSTGTVFGVSGNTLIVTVTDNVKKADGSSAGSQVRQNEYNILGQLTKTTDGYGTSTNPSITYTYDAIGNTLTAVINGGSAGTTTTTMEYDEAGNQKKIIGPDIGTVTSTYTALNQILTRTDNKSQQFTYSFDLLGRMDSVVSPDGTSTWEWDTADYGLGKLASRSSAGFTETYTYNLSSRVLSVVSGLTPIGGSGTTNYTTSHTYDTYGRPLNTTYPGGFVMTRVYNAQGYLSQLKNGANVVQTINDLDAFGNSIDESYGNGVNTLRTFDPETGRLTDINTTKGATTFQNNDYAWRSNGTLESRIANPAYGLSATRKEVYGYDVLNRIELAETFINGSNIRDLVYEYDQLGNIESKTSTVTGDTDVTAYAYGAGTAGPHAVTSASIDGVSNTLTYDLNGAVTKYDIAGTSDDKYLAYNAFNQPTVIVVGSSLADSSPEAKDEFAYGPNGQRYSRRTTWKEGSTTKYEVAYYIGPVEIIYDNDVTNISMITKTKLSPNVMHVEMFGTTTESFFEYAHRDHLGSIEVVTDESGNKLDNLAFDPFGSRKKPDWLASISSSELDNLIELDWGHSRKVRGFTGHEHLDRTGFIHMNGRIYDPVLGRFLSPDPFVPYPTSTQSWNRYSYVRNSPASFTDPSGYLDEIVKEGQRLDEEPTGRQPPPGAMINTNASAAYLANASSGSFRSGGQSGNSTGPSDDAIEEITVTMSLSDVVHHGPGSFTYYMGTIGSYMMFGVFNSSGGAGVRAFPIGRNSPSSQTSEYVGPSLGGFDSDGISSRDNPGPGVQNVIDASAGVTSLIGEGLEVVADSHLAAFAAATRGQHFRSARIANLGNALKPLKAFATKLGVAGLTIDVLSGIGTFIATGNPVPLVVSGIGFGAGVVIASYSAPAAFGFAVVYGVAGYYGLFDSDRFD